MLYQLLAVRQDMEKRGFASDILNQYINELETEMDAGEAAYVLMKVKKSQE
jgi:hypothetical protein